MAKFDEQLSRMEYLMGYKMPVNESVSNIEFHTNGADGKVYGILREGSMYYIKTTEPGKENLSESYQYIDGFRYRKENAFNSYNKAKQILDQKIIALNESYGVHEDILDTGYKRDEKILEGLTTEARKDLDRIKLIMENSMGIKDNIGNHGNPEGKGKSTGAQTEKNNDPFEEKATPKMDEDIKATETDPKKANSEYTDASKSVEKQMTSDKAPTANDTNAQDDYEDAKSDLEGESVAEMKPKGGKAVMVNEGAFDDDVEIETVDDEIGDDDFNLDTVEAEDAVDDTDIVGIEDEDLDTLMEEFKEKICGDDETLTGPHGTLEVQTDERLEEEEETNADETQEALDGPKGNGEAIAFERLSESMQKKINLIAESVTKQILKENLDVWGKHPRYGEQPMTTPPNTEVMKGTADHDCDDESAKGSEQYGKKIGDGKPFDKKVDVLTDAVVNMVKESLGLKKK